MFSLTLVQLLLQLFCLLTKLRFTAVIYLNTSKYSIFLHLRAQILDPIPSHVVLRFSVLKGRQSSAHASSLYLRIYRFALVHMSWIGSFCSKWPSCTPVGSRRVFGLYASHALSLNGGVSHLSSVELPWTDGRRERAYTRTSTHKHIRTRKYLHTYWHNMCTRWYQEHRYAEGRTRTLLHYSYMLTLTYVFTWQRTQLGLIEQGWTMPCTSLGAPKSLGLWHIAYSIQYACTLESLWADTTKLISDFWNICGRA
jgi:hypothetical protein